MKKDSGKDFTKKTNNHFKTNLKDWHWWYKLVAFILVTTCLLIELISRIKGIADDTFKDVNTGIRYPRWEIKLLDGSTAWDYSANIAMFFSYYSYQTGILVLIWFAYAVMFPQREGSGFLLSFTWSLSTATYITLTCLLWTFGLLPGAAAIGQQFPPERWFSRVTLHTIVPILFVVYVVMFMNHGKKQTTKQWIKNSWLVLIYPVVYMVFILLRGEARYRSGFSAASSYPYFIFEIHADFFGISGWVWFIISVVTTIGMFIAFSIFYVWAINFYFNKLKFKQNLQSQQVLEIEPLKTL